MELCDGHSSAKVFYKTLSRQSPREEPENVQSDSELGASTRADQEIVDVILSGRVSTSSVAFPSLPCASLLFLTRPFSYSDRTSPPARLGILGPRTHLRRPCRARSATCVSSPRRPPRQSSLTVRGLQLNGSLPRRSIYVGYGQSVFYSSLVEYRES